MKRPDTSSARPNHRAPMQMMTFVTSLGMLLIAEASLPDVGLGQSYRPLPQTDARDGSLPRLDPMGPQGRMQAPVGHRQPRVQDLPPGVLRKEGGEGGINADQELDQKLEICKGC
jgi:hypothetical protein